MIQKTLGILGGMGPLASLEFLRTIYECNLDGRAEQDYPNVILHSLSSVPDRTHSLLNDREQILEDCLARNLQVLNASGVAAIIICCFTSHCMLSRLPQEVTEKVVSLVDVTARELLARREKSLLLASLGSYRRRVFSSTDEAMQAREYIVEPDEADKLLVQDLIYRQLKPGKDVTPVYRSVRGLLDKYRLGSFIAGCSEFHLLSRYIRANDITDVAVVDPLIVIAERLEDVLMEERGCKEEPWKRI